jgi:preprotein translocase subunit SecA
LKEGIGLRGYGQKDPRIEYQREAYQMFLEMLDRIKKDTIEKLFAIQIAREEEVKEMKMERKQTFVLSRGEAAARGGGEREDGKGVTVRREGKKVGRNDPCPCGSGKKYKKCCLLKETQARA